MKKTRLCRAVICATFAVFSLSTAGLPCTTFQVDAGDRGKLYGRNLDYPTGVGFLSTNARNLRKTAFLVPGVPWRPAEWTSLYGSVAFSQLGRELPYGGMNETGLVVEVMVLSSSQYPSSGSDVPTVNESGLVQYLLDTQSTAAGAAAAAQDFAVRPTMQPLHYLVCDVSGDCLSIEFIAGAVNIHTGASLPIAGLANDTYEDSIEYLALHEGFGGSRPIPTDESSLSRFVRMARHVRNFSRGGDAIEAAFAVLDDVAQTGVSHSVWQVVYDQSHREVHFRTAAMPDRTSIKFDDLSFDCQAPGLALDLDGSVSMPARQWFHDQVSQRVELTHQTLKGLGRDMPEDWIVAGATHAEHSACQSMTFGAAHPANDGRH